jgi:hypothetical protein
MYLEAEVYGMLNWGFAIVMGIELISFIALWLKYKFSKEAFGWFIGHVVFFSFAGYKLLEAINTFEHHDFMGSENASLSICLLQNKNTEFCKENVQSLIG